MTHTPLPWSIFDVTENVIGGDGSPITKEFSYDIISEEDMEYAIKCVNSHAELVNLLKQAREKLGLECGGVREYKGGTPSQVLFPAIDDLLKRIAT